MENHRKSEYESQFFGISSDVCVDSFKDCLKFEAEQGVKGLAKKVEAKLLDNAVNHDMVRSSVSEAVDSLSKEYSHGVDYAMSKTEEKLRECFHIPDNVCLEEDKIAKEVSDVDRETLEKEIEALRQRMENANYMVTKIKDEMVEANLVVQRLSTLNDLDSTVFSTI